ncbi:hypothetical protein A359_01080 [secondary endosymbiont of Ctenarytaina eucalypti]|uniref:Uncharacterized protein n=1 Tax=secondary endosymbiont of Ctenarytaina eucalypti TaxID=1199245 RepID=J3TEY6_9ENTR|nr:hypothetical protein A359_01080 [secondary endosymbiont of Ctenarytaina eucalypti]
MSLPAISSYSGAEIATVKALNLKALLLDATHLQDQTTVALPSVNSSKTLFYSTNIALYDALDEV